MLAMLAGIQAMGAITIRNIDDRVVSAIKRKAAEHGLSMEEEVRKHLAATYAENHQQKAREWAERQLERLHRGELPTARTSAVAIIREMREERDQQLMDAIEGRRT
jgi:plasmid stability protein